MMDLEVEATSHVCPRRDGCMPSQDIGAQTNFTFAAYLSGAAYTSDFHASRESMLKQ